MSLGFAGLGMLAVVALFWSGFASMGQVWITSATYGHGPLVPVISAWLVWRDRDRLRTLAVRPSALGLAMLVALSAVWFVADAVQISLITHLTCVALLQAAILAILGWSAVRRFAFPLVFLIFMVPFGDSLIPPLQAFTGDFIVMVLRWLQIPVFVEGNLIHLSNGSFEVAEACAGLRFLIAMMVVAALFAHVTYRTWVPTVVFLVMALVVPVFMNGIRALAIVLVGYWSDRRLAVDIDHIVFGWVFLSLVMVAVLGLGLLLRERGSAPPLAEAGSGAGAAGASPPRVAMALVLALAAMAGGPALRWTVGAAVAPGAPTAIDLPETIGPWHRAAASDWQPDFQGPDAEAVAAYIDDDRTVALYVAHYRGQGSRGKAVSGVNRLGREPPWSRFGSHPVALAPAGQAIAASAALLAGPAGERRLATQLFWIDGTVTANPLHAKLRQLWLLVRTGTQPATVVVLAAPYESEPAEAAVEVAAFAATLPDPATLLRSP